MTSNDNAGSNNLVKAKQRRAGHTNSHTGCLTCKQRRVKCDEQQPICRRCEKARRDCKPDPRLSKQTSFPGQTSFTASSWTTSTDAEAYEESCLEHFKLVTLPAFHRCEPSSLWEYMKDELHSSSSIRAMATALGHEHRMTTSPSADVPAEASMFSVRAVQSLRQTIVDADTEHSPDTMFKIVFHCLLLVILQCMRKSFDELNIHLQHGLRIASQAANDDSTTMTAMLRESSRLLKQYSIAVALFNPLLPQSAIQSGIATTTANQALSNPDDLKATPSLSTRTTDDQFLRDEEQNLLLDLIGTTVTHRKPHVHDGGLNFTQPLKANAALLATVTGLRARHRVLELALQERASAKDTARRQYVQVAEARCMLLGIYLRCRWSGYACNYDLEHDTFARILDKIESSLELDEAAAQNSAPAFSIGLGTVAPLFYTAAMCREPEIRRRAVDLLSTCPQQDGPWNSKLVEAICRTKIAYEEKKAEEEGAGYALTGYIPEHCRIAYYYYFSESDAETTPREKLRVFRKQVGSTDVYTHEDLDLDYNAS